MKLTTPVVRERDGPEISEEYLKGLSLEELREIGEKEGLDWPKSSKPQIERMFLVRKIKEHCGLAKPKTARGGPKPRLNTTLAVLETHESVHRIESELAAIRKLLEKLLG